MIRAHRSVESSVWLSAWLSDASVAAASASISTACISSAAADPIDAVSSGSRTSNTRASDAATRRKTASYSDAQDSEPNVSRTVIGASRIRKPSIAESSFSSCSGLETSHLPRMHCHRARTPIDRLACRPSNSRAHASISALILRSRSTRLGNASAERLYSSLHNGRGVTMGVWDIINNGTGQ
jgi:hypothetical protein